MVWILFSPGCLQDIQRRRLWPEVVVGATGLSWALSFSNSPLSHLQGSKDRGHVAGFSEGQAACYLPARVHRSVAPRAFTLSTLLAPGAKMFSRLCAPVYPSLALSWAAGSGVCPSRDPPPLRIVCPPFWESFNACHLWLVLFLVLGRSLDLTLMSPNPRSFSRCQRGAD